MQSASSGFFIADAVGLLASLGWSLECQCDRFSGRVAQEVARLADVSPESLFRITSRRGQRLANLSILGCYRAVIRRVLRVVPRASWLIVARVRPVLPSFFPWTAGLLVEAIRCASLGAHTDWRVECLVWGYSTAPSGGCPMEEDWPQTAWEAPLLPPRSFPRLAFLDHRPMLAEGDSPIFAFTDGSFIPHSGVASSAAGFERVGLEGFGRP